MGCSVLLKKASLVGAFFVSVVVTPAVAFCPLAVELPQVDVRRVVDGDTLVLVDGRKVRLIGLNTPELAHDGRSAEVGADAAQRRLQALVEAGGGRVGVRLGDQARDRHGRTLAHAYGVDGRNLEAQLLAEGLGWLVAVAPNGALVECQQAAERQARAARLGVWRQASVQTPERLEKSGFALLRARVARVERNRGGLWIELQGGLTARIEPALLGLFEPEQISTWVGRRVEVRGWVVDRGRRGGLKSGQARWLLPLTHPAMLELLP
ncbi:MAG: thermonuclease family protein [Pseudomonas sp.]|uniref:thermonuclease family protein n=1 Tax=Pseudomonas sp. TaxID=306 RepID=UPI003393E0D1